jgi:hypothetical protein
MKTAGLVLLPTGLVLMVPLAPKGILYLTESSLDGSTYLSRSRALLKRQTRVLPGLVNFHCQLQHAYRAFGTKATVSSLGKAFA